MFCWCYPGALSDNYAISQDPLLKMASKDLVILCLTQDAILSITRQLDSVVLMKIWQIIWLSGWNSLREVKPLPYLLANLIQFAQGGI